MGLSKTQIYNNALLKVSKKQVDTPDDETFEADMCNALWEQALDRSLACHNWKSAIKTVQLTETSGSPTMYDYTFQLPNDCIEILKAYKSTDRDDFDFEWDTHGSEFYTDQSTIYIKYVARPTNTEFLSTHLTDVIIWNLAIAISYPMTNDGAREGELRQELESIILPRARANDAMQGREIEYEESPWIESFNGTSPSIGRP